jgi:hypothetical protein
VRYAISVCVLLLGCTQPEPVQDPLDYLRIGVDPTQEANAVAEDLRLHGFTVGRRIEQAGFVAFDASNGADSTVRIVTSRGPAFSIQVPDVRWPERLSVELAPEPRPDFDRDGQSDVVVAIRERGRTCLGWAQVDSRGFVSEVLGSNPEWGESPCVIHIDSTWPRLLLEVSVPDSRAPGARVRFPLRATARTWIPDDSPAAAPQWAREVAQREEALAGARSRGDEVGVQRLEAELAWLERLRNAEAPVLEPADDGEEAR